ncbi:hypothetical protein B296_00006000 [Ensete ventricosum]|uniref:Uncharacterized protein n=1 Tax=Ensete ventricosum TaxID=4639 RepID=A0A426YQA4_ENSVE|nr:hypothetical protein B296_00006000 [Ensete ventricosum]
MARPSAEVAGHGQAPYGAASHGLAIGVVVIVSMVACNATPVRATGCTATPARGGPSGQPTRDYHPRPRLPLVGAAALVVGAATSGQGQSPIGQGRQRQRSEGLGRGLGHPFEKRIILPLRI